MPPIRNAVESKALPRVALERAQIHGRRRNDSLAPPIGMARRRPVCAGGAVLRAARARGRSRCSRPPTIRWRSPTAGWRARSTTPSPCMRSRRRSMPTMPISPRASSISPPIAAWRCRRSSSSASTAAVEQANSASAAADSFAQRADHRRAEGHGGACRHGARRPVRVRRYPRCGARGQPLRQRRELRSADPGSLRCRHRDHRRHLRHGRRGDAGAGRAVGGEGGAQDRAVQRAAGRLDRPLACAMWSTGRR